MIRAFTALSPEHRVLVLCARSRVERAAKAEVARLVRWIRQIDCYELPMSSLEEAVKLVPGAAAPARP